MTAELLAYIVAVSSAIALALRAREIEPRMFALAAFVGFALLSATIRTSGFDSDMSVYAREMAINDNRIYYLREFAFWYAHRAIYFLVRHELLTLYISDLIGFAILFAALKRFSLPQYAFIAALSYFPIVLGMQNVYRQWIASCLVLLFASMFRREEIKGWIAFGFAFFCHNASAVFALPVALRKWSLGYGFIVIATLVAVPVAISFGAGGKSSASTGAPLELAYPLTLLVMAAFCAASIVRRDDFFDHVPDVISILAMAYVGFVAAAMLSSATAERISLFAMLLAYPQVVLAADRFRLGPALRVAIVVFGFAPVLIFSTRHMIMTA